MTQAARLLAYLRARPRSSSLEIIRDLAVTNATGRLSDLREQGLRDGFEVVKVRRSDNRWGYEIREQPVQLRLDVAS
jgi:hypothetical protein